MTGKPVVIQPRMPVGPQGPKGDPAPEVKIQYSTDNSTWHDTFQAGDIYMRISTDGGSTWTQGYKFIGDDGQDAPNVLIQFSPDNANWHTDYQQGDAYVRFSNDNGVTWTNGVPVAVNADTVDGYHATDFVLATDYEDLDVLNKIKNVDGTGSGLDADTVDGFDTSQTPTANTIPVADAAGTISPKWIDVYSLIPYWKVSIDETSGSRTTPTNFTVSRVVKYMSYGLIYWHSQYWGTWSSLWEMKVKSPTAISITGKIVLVDDNVYIYLNNNLVVSATGAGFKNLGFTLNLVSGDNLIQIVHNNTGGGPTGLDIEIDFDWRTLEFVPI